MKKTLRKPVVIVSVVTAAVGIIFVAFNYPTFTMIRYTPVIRAHLKKRVLEIARAHPYDEAGFRKLATAPMEKACWIGGEIDDDPQSQALLGMCYLFGAGSVKKDEIEAFGYFQMSAKQGNAMGQFYMGWCYWFGRGVGRDPVEAVNYFRLSAEKGNSSGLFFLGRCYRYGFAGVPQDEVEAVKLWQKSAEKGDCEAYAHLGMCYQEGIGVTKDEEMANTYRMCAESLGWRSHKGETSPW